MSHSQVRRQSDQRHGARRPKKYSQHVAVHRKEIDHFDLLSSFSSPRSKPWFLMLAMLASFTSIVLSGCGGLTFRSTSSQSGSPGAATLSSVSCGTQSLTGSQSKACSANLTAATTNAMTVMLSSSNPALTVPGFVIVAAGESSAAFNATSSAVSKQISVTISASANGVTQTNVITLYPQQVALNNISCSSQALTGPATTACSVSLSAPPSSPTVVSLSSSSSDLAVPATVTVASGATTTSFNATASAVPSTEAVTLTATFNGVTKSNQIQLQASATSSSSVFNVQLSWAAPPPSSTPIAGYRVYRASSATSIFQALNSALEIQTTYLDSTIQNGQTYSYWVTSVDSSGLESPPSNSITISIPN